MAELPSLDAITADTPLRLRVAAAIAFPDKSMTERGLQREIARGRLASERIAGKIYTTLGYIGRMREQCLVNPKGSASGSEKEPADHRSGSFSTDRVKSAQDALQTMSLALIERSKSISPSGTGRNSTRVSRHR
ncbi:excisionase [Rhizobium sp. LjRoot254]|uniref:excisionase n=1 Tax=Rhizobium sp. LjRoot254 TaxID=3342297 RepID=UPI003ECEA1A6